MKFLFASLTFLLFGSLVSSAQERDFRNNNQEIIIRKKEACPVQAPCSTLPDSGCLRRRLITLQAGRAHCGQAASMDVLLN